MLRNMFDIERPCEVMMLQDFLPPIHTLAIKLYQENKRIVIRFDVIYDQSNSPYIIPDCIFSSLRDDVLINYPLTKPHVLDANFNYQNLVFFIFTTLNQERFSRHSLICELPTIPHLAVNVISTLLRKISSMVSQYHLCVNYVDKSIDYYIDMDKKTM